MGIMDKLKDATTSVVTDAKQSYAKTKEAAFAEASDKDVVPESAVGCAPLFEVVSHIEGKNAKVRLGPIVSNGSERAGCPARR